MRGIPTILCGILGLATGCATIYLGALLVLLLLDWLSTFVDVPHLHPPELLLPTLLAGSIIFIVLKKVRQASTPETKRPYQAFVTAYSISTVLTIILWVYLIYHILPTVVGD